jgi:hypothetical protein
LLAIPVDESWSTAKAVPDFDIVGALWISASDMMTDGRARKEDNQSDYRSPDPQALLPAVESGELKAASIDTESFQQLEVLMKELTRGGQNKQAALVAYSLYASSQHRSCIGCAGAGYGKRCGREYPAHRPPLEGRFD